MAKRRIISQLPAWNQTDDLTSFFGVTVDEVFQSGLSEQISGYIGRKPAAAGVYYLTATNAPAGATTLTFASTTGIQIGQAISGLGLANNSFIVAKTDTVIALNKPTTAAIPTETSLLIDEATDFYIGEPTASRAAYQLESGMISVDETGAITNALTYPDFVNYLASEGAVVNDHERMFETEYYSWAPPINIDMLVNYRQYYWFGDFAGHTDLPVLTLTIPTNVFTGSSATKTYKLPAPIKAISDTDDSTQVYVNGLPVTFEITGDFVVLTKAPPQGSTVMLSRVFDFAEATAGMTDPIDISDINTMGVTYLSSGMRLRILDMFHVTASWDGAPLDSTLWDEAGDQRYMVDGVGQSMRYTNDVSLVHGNTPQYVTIDRSSRITNAWSQRNLWVHGDTFAWSGKTFPERQATRPIIEFVRDLIMYPQAWKSMADPLFMLYDIEGVAYTDPGRYPGSNFKGNRLFGYAAGLTPVDPVLQRKLKFDENGYIVYEVDAETQSYTYVAGIEPTPITGMPCYKLFDRQHPAVTQSFWYLAPVVTSQGITNGFYDVPLNLQANPNYADITTLSRSTYIDQFTSIMVNQMGFTGISLGANSYRDTPRYLGYGNTILQHRAPMLKAMLLGSNIAFDLPDAIQYAEQEYNRFRNKFVFKIGELDRNGSMAAIDPKLNPTAWVTTALRQLRRDKNISFPFALNTIAGDRYFIPPTPTCLGVLPVAVPRMVSDTTYGTAVLMIQGHDGSFTPAFKDWRDNVMLQLEVMIYNSLPAKFRTEARPGFDIQEYIGGRFYAPLYGYSRDEVATILTPTFELWTQLNRFDYRTNTNYDAANPFTWNYNGVRDRFGNVLPGNWRAIYRWYYGTDLPHTRPWEMLGFLSVPSWWTAQYGAAPYKRSNTKLWTDLENGVIRGGVRAPDDGTYSRPGLADLIPVDNNGKLLDPVATGIVTSTVTIDVGSRPWTIGDHGPVENLWITSPAYRFALAIASFLMKPPRMVEQCWDALNIGFVHDQWVELEDSPRTPFTRPVNSAQYVFGETLPDGTVTTVTGISQWIADHMISMGQTSDLFGAAVRGLDVRLIHQMAGFVSLDNVQAVADNFGLVPIEDIHSILYRSPVLRHEVYSGVILEWTGHSWSAIGYDGRNQYFTVIPGDPNGPKGVISLATSVEPTIVPWRPNTYYPINILTVHLNSVYECIRSHTSGPRFENIFWAARPDLAASMVQAPRVITYHRSLPTSQQVPYGTEFVSYQDIADFLLGYERWLVSRGWSFTTPDPTTGLIRNWSLAVKEFLTWAQVKWSPGNFIALSPGMLELHFTTDTGTILNVESNYTGFFGLIDRSGQPIGARDAVINRLDGAISLSAKAADIFSARLEIAEVEHALVFDNTTIFEDIIYLPEINQRQPRLRLICNRSMDWAGRMEAPGFIIIGNQLKSNFEKAADDVRLMFDIELADQKELRDYARHVVGFQRRDYLDTLLLSGIEQFEFYQGMIQQKGAPGVFTKLMRSNRASENSNLLFLEEWAIRVGEYGAEIDPFFTFFLRQSEVRGDPQIIRFVTTSLAPLDWLIIPEQDAHWVDPPPSTAFFTEEYGYPPPKLPTAGPVRLDDVDLTVFNITDLPNVYDAALQDGLDIFPVNTRVWVYERGDHTFTVLKTVETGTAPNRILKVLTRAENSAIASTRIYFQQPMTIKPIDVGNYLLIDGPSQSDPDLQGFQVIKTVNVGGNFVDLVAVSTSGYDFTATPTEAPFVRILHPMRFANRGAVLNSGYAFADGDLIWVDAETETVIVPRLNISDAIVTDDPLPQPEPAPDLIGSHWVVLMWTGGAYTVVRSQPHRVNPLTISETVIYSQGSHIVDQQLLNDEPVIDDLVVLDPLAGLIAGVADREIDYKTDYDPARYNAGAFSFAKNPWGESEIGRVWWNLSTVKFLDPYTDVLGASSDRDLAELNYRMATWSRIAPGTSVDVYEWVESLVDPFTYMAQVSSDPTGVYVGAVYNAENPSWVETTVFDYTTQKSENRFYFWVKGRTTTPMVPFRHTDIASVAMSIEHPKGNNLPCMAAISTDALMVSGVAQALNDISTVLKVRLTLDKENAGRHDQYLMLRPNDESSLPPDWLWVKLRDSLSGFDGQMRFVPDPTLSPYRRTGIFDGQGMFEVSDGDGPRGGLLAARSSFLHMVNTIWARTPIAIERATSIPSILRSTPIDPHLIWTQIDDSYVFEPPPRNEWDVQVYSVSERNRLVTRPAFRNAVANGTRIRVLINGIGAPVKQRWSIWNYPSDDLSALGWDNGGWDPHAGWDNVFDAAYVDGQFSLATSYEEAVETTAQRDALVTPVITLEEGDRVLVRSDILGFWSIYRWMGTPLSGKPVEGFQLWRNQTYRTDEFVEYVDWYASGHSVDAPPIVSYPSINARNAVEGIVAPTNLFVHIDDNGHGQWMWTEWSAIAQQWTVVAIQDGTIALSTDVFLDPNRSLKFGPGEQLFGWDDGIWDTLPKSWDEKFHQDDELEDMIAARDGSWELRVLVEALRYGGLMTDGEVNELFFSMLNFIHAQQNKVDWAFKTSFMSLLGYNVPLQPTPVAVEDTTPSLIAYVDEVKPYHVKVREFSTRYNPNIDLAQIHVTDYDKPLYYDPVLNTYRVLDPNNVDDLAILTTLKPWSDWYEARADNRVRSFDMTMLFDRITPSTSTSAAANTNYVHTTVSVSLTANNKTIFVQDVESLRYQWINDVKTPVSLANPLQVKIKGHTYMVGLVMVQEPNTSTTRGRSGSLTTVTGTFLKADGVAGTLVEAIVPQPSASLRITDYYVATAEMPPKDLSILLDLDMRGTNVGYPLSVNVLSGDVLTFAATDNLTVGLPVIAPNIIKGTKVADLSATTVTLSAPITGPLLAGTVINFGLPTVIDGYTLYPFTAITDFDTAGFDKLQFDTSASGLLQAIYEGGIDPVDPATIEVNINPPLPSRPGGYDLRAPYVAPNHPQERVPFNSDDGLHLTITAAPLVGGPSQNIKVFEVGHLVELTTTLFFDLIAQSANAVLVYRDGVRATFGTDYTVDHFARTVTVNLLMGLARVNRITIHPFGFGGTSLITDRYFYAFTANPLVLQASTKTADTRVVVNGTPIISYTVSTNLVTLTQPPPVGSDVAMILYAGGVSTATNIQNQTLTYNSLQQWSLSPRDTITAPEHGGTIVEVNGLRLRPPATSYGLLTETQPYMLMPVMPISTTTVRVFVDGVAYTAAVPICTAVDPDSPYPFHLVVPAGQTPPTNIAGQFVFFDGLLVALDDEFTGHVAVALIFPTAPPDYTIENGLLTIYPRLDPADVITVFSFSNANSMGWQTVTYPLARFEHLVVPTPFARDYAMVSLDGKMLAPDYDYEFVERELGWDSLALDAMPWDMPYQSNELVLFNPGSANNVIASVCTADAAREEMRWMMNTITPAMTRMPPVYGHVAPTTLGWDERAWDPSPQGWDSVVDITPSLQQLVAVPDHGTIHEALPQFESRLGYLRLSPYCAGSLIAELPPEAVKFDVKLLLRPLSPKLEPLFPLPEPTPIEPGVVWINGERIEYFSLTRVDEVVTIGALRRGTMGTSIQEQRNVDAFKGNGILTTYQVKGLGKVAVEINGVPLAAASFQTQVVNGVTYVTLKAANASKIVISVTSGYTYPAGSQVYNGKEDFLPAVPIGIDCGNRELQPMHRIISG